MDAADYPDIARKAIGTMHTQVGDLQIGNDGIAARGLLVRHLVMPGYPENTKRVLEFIARNISVSTYINIMDQYYPMYRSRDYEQLSRRLSGDEYDQACRTGRELGLHRGFY
jgi:putative pyruvate formate lyase activating enzyme